MKEKPAAINCRRLQRTRYNPSSTGVDTISLKSSYTARLIALFFSVLTSSSTDARIVPISTIMFSKATRENIVDLRKKLWNYYIISKRICQCFFTQAKQFCKTAHSGMQDCRFFGHFTYCNIVLEPQERKMRFFHFFCKKDLKFRKICSIIRKKPKKKDRKPCWERKSETNPPISPPFVSSVSTPLPSVTSRTCFATQRALSIGSIPAKNSAMTP